MRINKSREMLENEIKGFIPLLASNMNKYQADVDLIVEHLNSKHGIRTTDIYSLFNNVNNVNKLSTEELALFGQQCVVKLGIEQSAWMNEWFTEREQKEFERYQFVDLTNSDEIDFPMVLQNVTELGNGFYNATLSKQELARLYKYGKLNYNPNVQRGMRKVERFGLVIEEPITIPSKIREIKKLNLKNELNPSTITLNASLSSALDGFELEYDSKKKTLKINEGTILDIVDGMHRTLGTYSAYSEDKEIQGSFPVVISNKSDAEIKKYQVDLDKHTPLTRSKIEEMKSKTFASQVANILKSEGQLEGKISTTSDYKSSLKGGDFTTYTLITKQIEDIFEINNTLEARKVAKTIDEYLVYLFGLFENYKSGTYSLLFDADVFEGHLYLAKTMNQNEVPFEKIESILKSNLEEFNIENSKLSSIVVGKQRVSNKDRKDIINVFKDMYEKGMNSDV